jgi:hypothetical protein
MIAVIGLGTAILALAVSAVTAWMTLFRRGRILMTQPTQIYFGPDGSRYGVEPRHQKVFFRTLLYSTAKKGHLIENMFVTLRRNETRQNFNIWVYGDDRLRRGSGLSVPEGGVATNHHFLLPPDLESFTFSPGNYVLEVFATIAGSAKAQTLFVVHLEVTQEAANSIREGRSGLYFDWGPDAARYNHHVTAPPALKAEASAVLAELFKDE